MIGIVVTRVCICVECGRTFDLWSDADADEWYHGHDCEEVTQ